MIAGSGARPAVRPALALALATALALTGCGKDDKVVAGGTNPPTYAAPTSPRNVLSNLITAYVNRDSVQTALVYDDAYAGQSVDPSGIAGNYSFTKASEVHHVGSLRLAPGVVAVYLDMGKPGTWQELPPLASDPAEWREIQINNWTLFITTSSGAALVTTNQTLTYTFKPLVSAPGDTAWTIVRWTELVTNPPAP